MTEKNELLKNHPEYSLLFEKIDTLLKKGRAIIAIEGASASGKTTLAKTLSKIYGATVFHMDDFFLPLDNQTPKRLSEVGGNVDRERFESEVLIPLSQGKAVNYRPFDCKTQGFKDTFSVAPKTLVIVEGAYSMHPSLSGYYDLSVFLEIDSAKQKERIIERNGDGAQRFFETWIPRENTYFEKTCAKERCDLIIKV